MSNNKPEIIDESGDKYKYGFVTDIEAETIPKGLNADIIRLISRKKGEPVWLLDYRMKAFQRNLGLRIDHILISEPLTKFNRSVVVNKNFRGLERPSDHAPVTLTLEL